VGMAPGEVTIWSGSDRQGEKVAIQGYACKDNPAIVAYFPHVGSFLEAWALNFAGRNCCKKRRSG